jgi:hypothetical protein
LEVRWNPFDPDVVGPCIRVVVMAPDIEMQQGRYIGLEYPDPLPITALIDTGSPFTIVSKVFAKNRKLRMTNPSVPLRTLGGSCTGTQYCCSMCFPDSDLPKIDVMGIVARDFHQEPHYACLIGRDVIRNWNINFDGRAGLVRITV